VTVPGRREPAVAGRFYPAGAAALAWTVLSEVDAVAVPGDEPPAPAYVVPHAGYRYSGPTAARVYARLRAHAGTVRRVLLIGPAHHVPLRGAAVPTVACWGTPLGDVRIDLAGARALAAAGHAVADDAPLAPEHSLEVQLPFLQRCLPATVPVLPVVIGQSTVESTVALLVAAGAGDSGTVLLCSTDLSHYLTHQAALATDRDTLAAVAALAPQRIGVRDACGVFALRGLLGWARLRELRPRLLHHCTSGDRTGDLDRVVGYAALALDAAPAAGAADRPG